MAERTPSEIKTQYSVTFTILRAKALVGDDNRKPDPYVIAVLEHNGNESAKDVLVKTEKIRLSLDPDWIANFDPGDLTATACIFERSTITFTVYDWGRVGKHSSLGEVVIDYGTIFRVLGTETTKEYEEWYPVVDRKKGRCRGELNLLLSLNKGSSPTDTKYFSKNRSWTPGKKEYLSPRRRGKKEKKETTIAPGTEIPRHMIRQRPGSISMTQAQNKLKKNKPFKKGLAIPINQDQEKTQEYEDIENEFVDHILELFERFSNNNSLQNPDFLRRRVRGDIISEMFKFEIRMGVGKGKELLKEDSLLPEIIPKILDFHSQPKLLPIETFSVLFVESVFSFFGNISEFVTYFNHLNTSSKESDKKPNKQSLYDSVNAMCRCLCQIKNDLSMDFSAMEEPLGKWKDNILYSIKEEMVGKPLPVEKEWVGRQKAYFSMRMLETVTLQTSQLSYAAGAVLTCLNCSEISETPNITCLLTFMSFFKTLLSSLLNNLETVYLIHSRSNPSDSKTEGSDSHRVKSPPPLFGPQDDFTVKRVNTTQNSMMVVKRKTKTPKLGSAQVPKARTETKLPRKTQEENSPMPLHHSKSSENLSLSAELPIPKSPIDSETPIPGTPPDSEIPLPRTPPDTENSREIRIRKKLKYSPESSEVVDPPEFAEGEIISPPLSDPPENVVEGPGSSEHTSGGTSTEFGKTKKTTTRKRQKSSSPSLTTVKAVIATRNRSNTGNITIYNNSTNKEERVQTTDQPNEDSDLPVDNGVSLEGVEIPETPNLDDPNSENSSIFITLSPPLPNSEKSNLKLVSQKHVRSFSQNPRPFPQSSSSPTKISKRSETTQAKKGNTERKKSMEDNISISDTNSPKISSRVDEVPPRRKTSGKSTHSENLNIPSENGSSGNIPKAESLPKVVSLTNFPTVSDSPPPRRPLPSLPAGRTKTGNDKFDSERTMKLLMEALTAVEPEDPLIKPGDPFRPGTVYGMLIRCMKSPTSKSLLPLLLSSYDYLTTIEEIWPLLKLLWTSSSMSEQLKITTKELHVFLGEVLLQLVQEQPQVLSDALVTDIKNFVFINRDKVGDPANQILLELKNQEIFKMSFDIPPPIVNIYDTNNIFMHQIIFHFNSCDIAEQMTLIDWEMYSKVKKRDLAQLKWDKEKERSLGHSVATLIERIDRISLWVATLILLHEDIEDRAGVVEHFVSVASCLLYLHKNFESLMGILTGLNTAAVGRLKKSLQLVSPETLAKLEALNTIQDPTSSFGRLRNVVKDSGSQILPYLGTCLADLTLIDEGNPNTFKVQNSEYINFPKCSMIQKAINEFLQYQHIATVNIKPKEPLYSFLEVLPCLGSKELYELSLLREPRET